MRSFSARRGLLIAVLAVAATAMISSGDRHLHLTKSQPVKDTTLAAAPTEIRLWFNQVPQRAVSRIGLTGPSGEVAVGELEFADEDMSFKAAVSGQLAPGPYTVAWRTAGDDGHAMRGEYGFVIRGQ